MTRLLVVHFPLLASVLGACDRYGNFDPGGEVAADILTAGVLVVVVPPLYLLSSAGY